MSNGKSKGSTFERDIAKYLSKWLKGSEKPYQYWRAPSSGALLTMNEMNRDASGDIMALTTDAKFLTDIFSIELKVGYPKTSFWQHFRDTKSFGIRLFWDQCCEDAVKAKKKPMLIYRRKGKSEIVGISYMPEILNSLTNINSLILKWKEIDIPQLYLFDMKEFFNSISPKEIKESLWQK